MTTCVLLSIGIKMDLIFLWLQVMDSLSFQIFKLKMVERKLKMEYLELLVVEPV